MEHTRVPKQQTSQEKSPAPAASPSRAVRPAPLAAQGDALPGSGLLVDLNTLPIFPPERKNATGMPDTLKTGVETLSGLSMDQVRVHYHSPLPARVRARAYTQGTDIHIGPGQEKHLPHEAWHVVQQMRERVKPTTRMGAAMLNDDEALEQEADREGKRANSLAPRSAPAPGRFYGPEPLSRPGQQAAARLPVRPILQRMPYDEIQTGRYYLVKIGKDLQALFLREKRGAKLTGTGKANFSFKRDEDPSSRTYLVIDEADILEEVPLANPNVLGLATWNVAHFSGHNIKEMLEQLQSQLTAFREVGDVWKQLPSAFQNLLQAIEEDRIMKDSMKPLEKTYVDEVFSDDQGNDEESSDEYNDEEESDDESEEERGSTKRRSSSKKKAQFRKQQVNKKRKASSEEFSDKKQRITPDVSRRRRSTRESRPVERFTVINRTAIKKLYDPQSRLKNLADLIKKYKTASEQFNIIDSFVDEMNKLAEFNWKEAYEQADSPEKRKLFAKKVKDLRKKVDEIKQLKKAYKEFDKLQEEQKLLEQLGETVQKQAAIFFSLLSEVKGTTPNKTTFDKSASALHSPNIVTHIEEMFERNRQWLDIMLLQEVNNPKSLEGGEHLYEVSRGPHLVSGGEKPQNEYYPLLIRKGSGISVENVYVVKTDGKMEPVEHNQVQDWNKRPAPGQDATYRPIVVYEIEKRSGSYPQRYWIGIVHTTPESDSSGVAEFNRRAIYKEIEKGLKTLKEKAAKQKIPLIIGGDYYLSAEAVVKELAEMPAEGSKEKQDYDKSKDAIEKLIEKIERELKSPGEEEKGPEAMIEDQRGEKEEAEYSGDKRKRIKGAIRDDLTIPGEKPAEEEETDPHRIMLRKIRLVLKEASKDEQILRTIYQLTVEKRVKKLGLYLAQTVSGTNPKKDPLDNWYYLQIADFFVHNEQLKSFTTGIMHPEGGILSVDTEDLTYSKYWQHFSDHFPVGIIYSLREKDLSTHPAVVGSGSKKAKEFARISNTNRFARLQSKTNYPSGTPTEQTENEALKYLKAWLAKLKQSKSQEDETMDIDVGYLGTETEAVERYIREIQALEKKKGIPPDERLSVRLPGDFEPDLESEDQPSFPLLRQPPGNPPGHGGDAPERGPGSPPQQGPEQGKGPGSSSQQGQGPGKGPGSTSQHGSGSSNRGSQEKDSDRMEEDEGPKGAEHAPQGSGSQTGQRTVNVGDLVLMEHISGEWTVVRVAGVKPGGKVDVEVPAHRTMLRWSNEPVSKLPPAPADKQLGDKFPKQ